MARKSVRARAINLSPMNVAPAKVDARSVEGKDKEVYKVIKWGINDKLPHDILDLTEESGTLSQCLDIVDAFIQADGFADKKAAEFKVNPKQEGDDLLDQISNDASVFTRAFALKVKYNAALEPAEAYHVPIQTIRRLDNGKFLINPTFGTNSIKKDQNEILDPFNPDDKESIRAMMEDVQLDAEGQPVPGSQKGQLYFVYRKTGTTPEYPKPKWFTIAGKADIETDAQIPKSDKEMVENNFQPPVIVEVIGDLDDTVKDDNGQTEWDAVEQTVSELTNPKNKCKAIVISTPLATNVPGGTGSGGIKLHSFDSKASLSAMDPKRDTIARAVCRHTGVHPVLIGLTTAGQLGQTQEIVNSIQLLQWQVNKTQRAIQRAFKRIFPALDWTVTTASPIKYIPQEVLDKMTDDEIRNLHGLQPADNDTPKETLKVITKLKALPDNIQQAVMAAMSPEQLLSFVGLPAPAPNENN